MRIVNGSIGLGLLLTSALAALPAACRSQPDPGDEPVTVDDLAPEPEPGSREIPVALSSYHIDMPTEVPAGYVFFRLEHRGEDVEHGFAIEGDTVMTEVESHLQPGESSTLAIDLPPGRYLVYCPVDNHQAFGMEHALTVVERDQ